MKINLIAVHYNSTNKGSITGFRLFDSDSNQVMDQPYNAVYDVIRCGKATINGIKLDDSGRGLKGSNGAFERYPSLFNNKPFKNSLIIVKSIDDKGYRVCNYLGKTKDAMNGEVVRFADKVGIANGKVVDKDGKRFISAISGTYDNIPFSKSELASSKAANLKSYDAQYSKKLLSETRRKQFSSDMEVRFPKAITGTPNPNSRLKELDADTGMTVEQKLAYCMIALRKVKPFYYSIYSCLRRVEANPQDDVNTMSVSLDTLYFNSDFVLEKTLPELLFVMIHEISHIGMKHRAREGGRDHDVWNAACDYYINRQIAIDFGLTERGKVMPAASKLRGTSSSNYSITLPLDCLYNENVDVNKDTPESIYDELMDIAKQNSGNNDNNNKDDDNNDKDDDNNDKSEQTEQNESENGQGSDDDPEFGDDSEFDDGDGSTDGNESSGQGKGKQGRGNNSSPSLDDDTEGEDSSSNLEDFADGKDRKEQENPSDRFDDVGNKNKKKNGNKKQQSNNDSSNKEDNNSNSEEGNSSNKDGNKEGNKGQGSGTQGQGNNKKDNRKGRLVGKEFRGQTITNTERDIVDDDRSRGLSPEQMSQSATSLLNRAVTVQRQNGSFGGDNADWLERYVEMAIAPKVNWVALLRNKLTLASQKINTFSAPDKRFRSRGMIMPGPKKLDNDSLENVKICIDTSGSISNKDIGVALSQIEQLFKQFHAEAELLYWDTRVRAVYPFKKPEELVNKKPLGGGGTDANCIFRYFEEEKDYRIGRKKKPSIIIIFTDGYFGEVSQNYKKYRNTIWVVNENPEFEAPFGSVAQFKNPE